MGIFKKLWSNLSQGFFNPQLWLGSSGAVFPTVSGIRVDNETALNYSAIWAATNLYANIISTLPVKVCMKLPNGEKPEATDHPLNNLIKLEPTAIMGSTDFFYLMLADTLNWGNFFAFKLYDKDRRVREIIPIHPSRIPEHYVKVVDGRLQYTVIQDDSTTKTYDQSHIFHIKGLHAKGGIYGRSTIGAGNESIGLGLAVEKFGASFFGNRATPGLAIKTTEQVTPEKEAQIRKYWQAYTGSAKGNSLVVLPPDMEIQQMSIPPEQAQFLQTRQFNITEIARWYNLPPHLLRELTKSSFNNIEQESIHYANLSLLPFIVRIEKEMNRQLFGIKDRHKYFVKFNMDSLLRGDSEARAKLYKALFELGALSQNDVRRLEDMDPIGPMGDKYYVMTNMMTLEQAHIVTKTAQVKLELLEKALEDKKNGLIETSNVPGGNDTPGLPDPETGEEDSQSGEQQVDNNNKPATNLLVDTLVQQHVEERINSLLAFENMLTTSVQGMVDYECRALQQKARNPDKLKNTLDDFYGNLNSKLKETLEPLEPAASSLGLTFLPENIADTFCNTSKLEIKDLFNNENFNAEFKQFIEVRKSIKQSQITNHIRSGIKQRIDQLSSYELQS